MIVIKRDKLSTGMKIKELRRHNRIPQDMFAEIIGVAEDKVRRAEKDKYEYTEVELQRIKERFNIVGLPLTEHERDIFYRHLYYVRSLIRGKRLTESRDIFNELTNIDNLEPCDSEIVALCKMFEAQLTIAEGFYVSAEKKLKSYNPDIVYDENTYHYFFNKGYLGICCEDYDEGLEYLLKAYELIEIHKDLVLEDDERLYYYIAICYTYIEVPYRAMFFIQKAQQVQVCSENRAPNLSLHLNRMLAMNCIYTNHFDEAKKLLDKCLIEYKSIKDEALAGDTLFFFGSMYRQMKNWDMAIEYYDSALNCLPDSTNNYFAALYGKIYCVIQTREFTKAGQMVEEAKKQSIANMLWTKYFEALQHYLTIIRRLTSSDNDKACNYIVNEALPYFYENHDYFLAIDYCRLLEQHYKKLKNSRLSFMMADKTLKIYERCLINHRKDVKL